MASYTYELIELGDEHALGCKCCRFDKGIDLPIPKNLSHEAVSKLARGFSVSIFKDWSKLNAILKRFEAPIQKRWLKKSPRQRKEILLNAWPEMPTTHRPDFAGFRNTKKNTPRSHTLPSAAFLWPYINLEDLQIPHHLLLFLNSRGRHLPGLFVQTDLHSAHLGQGWATPYNPGDHAFRMELYGQTTPSSYGRLISTKEYSSPSARQKILYGCSHGLLALEIQQQIYDFLLSCAKLILHDTNPRQFYLAPHMPVPGLLEAETKDWPTLRTYTLERSYLPPQSMDISRLAMMAGARRASAEDHLWLLTEDPGYFIDSLKDWKEHSRETIEHSCSHCWRHVAQRMVSNAFCLFIFWHWIHRQLTRMQPFEKQLARANHKTLRLDSRDEKLWLELVNVIQLLEGFPIAILSSGLKASPRLRHTYFTDESVRRGNPEPKGVPKKQTEAEKRVDLLFHAIVSYEKRQLHTLNRLVQEVQHMLETDAEANLLIDSWLSCIFADLAMLSELNTRVDCLDPWACGWGATEELHSRAAEKPMDDLFALDEKLRTGIAGAFASDAWLDEHVCLDILVDGRLEYPAAKRHTEDNVKKMRFAEAVLDLLWEEIEASVRATSNISVKTLIKNRLLEPRIKYRTPEWMPPLIAPAKPAVLTELHPNVPRFGEGTTMSNVVTPAKEKTKTKTRGTATPLKDDPDDPTLPDSAPETPPSTTIKVPKRAYKVLSALFPQAGAASHQRSEIAWEELLQAMDCIGLQPMKLYGSVWIFMPRSDAECKVQTKRSIQFHEPEEVRRGSKIPASSKFIHVLSSKFYCFV